MGISAPTLLVIGDADSTRPEHTVEMVRLLGDGIGDVTGPSRNAARRHPLRLTASEHDLLQRV